MKIKEFKASDLPILEEVLGLNSAELILSAEENIPNEKLNKINTLISRVQTGEPIQYVLGHTYFFKDSFFVNRNVLIPRPETEGLVEMTIENIERRKSHKSLNILDICTGSGCIGISVSKYVSTPHSLYMTDLSPEALEVCRENAKMLLKGKQNIHILRSNLLEVFKKNMGRTIDILVANPPYIPSPRIPTLENTVKNFEPYMALDGGEDGTDLIKKILYEAKDLMSDEGYIAIEIDETQGNHLLGFARSLYVKKEISIIKDLTGRDRYLEIK